jgi:hypothetical protein
LTQGPVPGRRLLSALSALSVLSAPLQAQQTAQVSGRVVRATATDTVSVPGVQVMLHQVGRARQGPVDSALAGPKGEFRFRFRPDTSSVYLLSAGWAGIEYFSTPVRSIVAQPDTGLLLVVSDTSSVAPVSVVSRHIVIGKPRGDGIRAALEIVVLQNNGPLTRVARDSLQPTWTTRLPSRAFGFQPGEGDVSTDALVFRDGAVELFAPIAPGEKQLLYTYQLPSGPGTVRIPLREPVGMMNILLEEFDRTVTGGAIVKGDSQAIEGRSFRQWSGTVPAGGVVALHFPSIGSRWVLPVLVSGVALSLAFVAIRALRGRPSAPVRPAEPLLDQLARLDAQYRGREGEVPADEWSRYQAERQRLKEELSGQLAGKRPPT